MTEKLRAINGDELFQQVECVNCPLSFQSAEELATELREAEKAHAEHERITGEHDLDWASWYANWMFGTLERGVGE